MKLDPNRRTCHVCGVQVKVTVTGRLYKHKRPRTPGTLWAAWCENTSPGAGLER